MGSNSPRKRWTEEDVEAESVAVEHYERTGKLPPDLAPHVRAKVQHGIALKQAADCAGRRGLSGILPLAGADHE